MDGPAVLDDAIAWRRHLHRHPELSFREHATARFIRETMLSFGAGMEVTTPTPTSVVGRVEGRVPGPTLVLRAEIDALPIHELSGVEFASVHDGVMHACGHDAHTAVLLAVARLLTRRRQQFRGELRFLFQHAEERLPGGAAELVEAGALTGADAVIGCHLLSTIDVGKVAVIPGTCMAASDEFRVLVRGRGGHPGFQERATDPIALAAHAIVNLQRIVAQQMSRVPAPVIAVTWIRSGGAENVIPETAEFRGTVRTLRDEDRDEIRASIGRALDSVITPHRAKYELVYRAGYAAVHNDPALAELVGRVAGEACIDMEPVMAADDFSAYLTVCPGCYFFVGAGGETAFPHHHPRFVLDEGAMAVAIGVMSSVALEFLR